MLMIMMFPTNREERSKSVTMVKNPSQIDSLYTNLAQRPSSSVSLDNNNVYLLTQNKQENRTYWQSKRTKCRTLVN